MMVRSEKIQLSCRVSSETYQKVKALTEVSADGKRPAFESIAEYLQSLIHADLAKREMKHAHIPMMSYTDYLADLERRITILEKEKEE